MGEYDDPQRAARKAAGLGAAKEKEGYRAIGPGVPPEARYDEEEDGWGAGEMGPDGKTGTWRFWRTDGTFAEESEWRHGRMHGTHRRHHDDGSLASLASLAEWADGKRRHDIVYRAAAPSRETTLDGLTESVRVMVRDFDDEGCFVRQRFYTADETEVDFDGEPIPPRPANVPALRACLATEPDRLLRADLLLGLALHPGEATGELLRPFLDDEDPLVRFCAGLTWIRAEGGPGTPAVPAVTAAITGAAGLDAFGGLFLAPADAYAEGEALTGDRRAVVLAVGDAEVAWTFNASLHEVLRYNGLPADRGRLRALLGPEQGGGR
ncbi:hypothetical protein [Nonomuraea typhae]|uniref:HEAT repeat domain-containing protein n=1 Tax=Nonomuraea typhae TaxID=2603600 RepID=A0ABW7Z1F2_9ACTN